MSQFGDALDSIRAGHSLSEAIAGIDGFEVKLSSSVAVGEETGKLDSLLATISETLDYEAEMATKRLVTLLEPVMIVIMGLVVGGIVAERERSVRKAAHIDLERVCVGRKGVPNTGKRVVRCTVRAGMRSD